MAKGRLSKKTTMSTIDRLEEGSLLSTIAYRTNASFVSFSELGVNRDDFVAILTADPLAADDPIFTEELANEIADRYILVQGFHESVELAPGISVTVEIKTDTRRIVEFFFEPAVEISR